MSDKLFRLSRRPEKWVSYNLKTLWRFIYANIDKLKFAGQVV